MVWRLLGALAGPSLKTTTVHEPLEAKRIAEPTDSRVVKMLEVLPPAEAEF